MRKGLILLLIMILILFNVDTRALRAKKIDLRLMEQEKAVVFLRLSGSISLLINDGDNSNLFILEYKNDNNLNYALQVFDSNPDIYYLKNMTEKRIDDIYVLKDRNGFKLMINNYTLCAVNNKKEVNNCDFVYLMQLNQEFYMSDNILAVFYDDGIDKKWLGQVQESWVDNNMVSTDNFTILKINEESYNIIIVPSTNQSN